MYSGNWIFILRVHQVCRFLLAKRRLPTTDKQLRRNRAAGLFIWAKTIVWFINLGEPKEQLGQIMDGNSAREMDIGDLYSRILHISFPKPSM
ncbi:hypothetical protein CPB86DRAFT_792287 [Serendipita vermifera]|nr:hypothetical protein CPB86DRAFT_792287 [Serendipita vermifera]